jgi:hypothetical protein
VCHPGAGRGQPPAGGARWLSGRLLADHEVADLTLEEPDIEDIVRRIYRGESPP